MNYPAWIVPIIGSGWVIGMIAILHVSISHFAIGGGFFLPMAEAKGLKIVDAEGRRAWIDKLRGYSKFFLILTGVVGAVTGVGIWFAIGLVSPEGTSTLIHNFVFGWAIEWVVFMVELSFAAVYYYTWDRVSDALHLRIGYIYAVVSFLTLFIINGILTFMLTPGPEWLAVAGTGDEASRFFPAFFNPTFWPSLCLRTLVCIALAGIYALVVFSRIDGDKEGRVKRELIRWSAMWLLPAFFLVPVFFAWYLLQVPESQRALLGLGIATIGSGAFTQITRMAMITVMTSATILGVVYFLAYRSPRDFKFGHALAVLILAVLATGATESSREMLRKPYVVGGFMFSNGLRVYQAEKFNEEGYLTHSMWAPAVEASLAPEKVGQRMFYGQCMACHTLDGYRGMIGLLQGRDERAIGNVLKMLHDYKDDSPYRKFMPPLVGTPEEIDALKIYLNSIANPGEAAKEKAAPALPAATAPEATPAAPSPATSSTPAPSSSASAALGQQVYAAKCASCHAGNGKFAIGTLLKGKDAGSIAAVVDALRAYPETSPYRKTMPKLAATDGESEALKVYLGSLATPAPAAVQ